MAEARNILPALEGTEKDEHFLLVKKELCVVSGKLGEELSRNSPSTLGTTVTAETVRRHCEGF